jgi:hemerythrin-like domain-containing protein
MNIIELLKQQHEEVRDLLERMIAENDKKEIRTLLGQLSKTLRLHMLIEEKMVYPAATRAFQGDEDDEETVLESYEEHALIRQCLEALEKTVPSDKRFVVRAKLVKELLDKHIEDEESDMFPELEGKLGRDGVEKLGDQVQRRMSQIEAEAMPARAPARARRAVGSRAAAGTGRGGRASRATSRRGAGGQAAKSPRATRRSASRSQRTGSPSSGSKGNNGSQPRRRQSKPAHL